MMQTIPILVTMILIGYFVLYFGGRKYLETFNSNNENNKSDRDNQLNMTVYPPDKPYVTSPIYDLDDYEYSRIFQLEGTKEVSKQQLNDAMSRYPLDWSTQPPDSQHFQENQNAYLHDLKKDKAPPYTGLYKEIEGSDLTPPDMKKIDEEEQKILQTYKPESSKGLLSYSLDDVKHLIDKVYGKRGLIPTIERSHQGPNVYEVVEVHKKNEPIVWEDDYERMADSQRAKLRGEELIEVPYTVGDITAGLDPFFQGRTSVRNRKNDYTKWTPGLERSFAPTYPEKSWF